MTPPLIDSLTAPPVVGERYLVPCLRSRSGLLLPLIGPLHADPEIGVAQVHGHLDLRFVSEDAAREVALRHPANATEPARSFVALCPIGVIMLSLFVCEVTDERRTGITVEPLVCLRPMPLYRRAAALRWIEGLEARYRGAALTGGRCPHKGLPLLSLPLQEGRRVCPGHGLCFSEEGRLVPLTAEEREDLAWVRAACERSGVLL